jgi:hypothetical protein
MLILNVGAYQGTATIFMIFVELKQESVSGGAAICDSCRNNKLARFYNAETLCE